jgi:hypothetical protein
MENDDDFTKSINRQVSFDLIFPHSKIVEIISMMITQKEFFEGHHSKALDTVAGIFLIDVFYHVPILINRS